MSDKQWSHNDLAQDLAGHLKTPNTMVWTDLQLGPAGSPRPDVYYMLKSYMRPSPMAYEVKISRGDFLADVTTGKWSSYLEYAYGVIFAMPAGMIKVGEVPDRCGLIFRHAEKWRMAKRVTINPHPIPQEALIKLLIDGVYREGPAVRANHWRNYVSVNEFTKKFGEEAARWINDSIRIKEKVRAADENCQRMIKIAHQDAERMRGNALLDMPQLWNSLVTVLKLETGADEYDIRDAIRKLKEISETNIRNNFGIFLDEIDRKIRVQRQYLESFNVDRDKGNDTGGENVLPVRSTSGDLEDP